MAVQTTGEDLERVLEVVEGPRITPQQPGQTAAPDADALQQATDAVVTAFEGKEGLGQVTSNLSASLPYVAVSVDRDKAASLGLSEVAVGALVSNTMQPRQAGTVEIDGTSLTVYLQAASIPTTIDELPDRDVLTPSQLNTLARNLLEDTFPLIWVEGELVHLGVVRQVDHQPHRLAHAAPAGQVVGRQGIEPAIAGKEHQLVRGLGVQRHEGLVAVLELDLGVQRLMALHRADPAHFRQDHGDRLALDHRIHVDLGGLAGLADLGAALPARGGLAELAPRLAQLLRDAAPLRGRIGQHGDKPRPLLGQLAVLGAQLDFLKLAQGAQAHVQDRLDLRLGQREDQELAVVPDGGEVVALDPPDGLWIEVAGAAHLFGDEDGLVEDLLTRLAQRALSASAGVADTPGAAWAVARFLPHEPVVPPGGHAAALVDLPVQALRLAIESADGLAQLGIERYFTYVVTKVVKTKVDGVPSWASDANLSAR